MGKTVRGMTVGEKNLHGEGHSGIKRYSVGVERKWPFDGFFDTHQCIQLHTQCESKKSSYEDEHVRMKGAGEKHGLM